MARIFTTINPYVAKASTSQMLQEQNLDISVLQGLGAT
jgi:hypothetical protein